MIKSERGEGLFLMKAKAPNLALLEFTLAG